MMKWWKDDTLLNFDSDDKTIIGFVYKVYNTNYYRARFFIDGLPQIYLEYSSLKEAREDIDKIC